MLKHPVWFKKNKTFERVQGGDVISALNRGLKLISQGTNPEALERNLKWHLAF